MISGTDDQSTDLINSSGANSNPIPVIWGWSGGGTPTGQSVEEVDDENPSLDSGSSNSGVAAPTGDEADDASTTPANPFPVVQSPTVLPAVQPPAPSAIVPVAASSAIAAPSTGKNSGLILFLLVAALVVLVVEG